MKLNLDALASLENQTTAIQVLNENFSRIETALENTFSRDGTAPNALSTNVDFNSRRGINLSAPVSATDAARLIDITNLVVVAGNTVIPSQTGQSGKRLSTDGANLLWTTPTSGLEPVNNLSDVTSVSTARTNLGLGTSATYNISTTGNNVPLLSGLNTWTNNQSFAGASNFGGPVILGGAANHTLAATSATLTEDSVGYRGVPRAVQNVDHVFAMADSGQMKLHTSGVAHTFSIPSNAQTAFPMGTYLMIVNTGVGVVNLIKTVGVTFVNAVTGTNPNPVIAQYGSLTALKIDTNTWYINGSGYS